MKMILVMTAKNGKTREAIAALKPGHEYVCSKYGLKGEMYLQVFGGTAGTFYLITDFQDPASAQAFQAKLLADEKYWEYVQKLAEVTIGPPTIAFLQPF